jgi:hypothetical protein
MELGITLDMMHLILGNVGEHLMRLVTGKRLADALKKEEARALKANDKADDRHHADYVNQTRIYNQKMKVFRAKQKKQASSKKGCLLRQVILTAPKKPLYGGRDRLVRSLTSCSKMRLNATN